MVGRKPKKRKAGRLLLEDGEVLIKTFQEVTKLYILFMLGAVGIGIVGLVEWLVNHDGDALRTLSAVSLGLVTCASSFGVIKYHLTNQRLAQEKCSGKLPHINLEDISEIRLDGEKQDKLTVCTRSGSDEGFFITSKKAVEAAQEIQAACSRLTEK